MTFSRRNVLKGAAGLALTLPTLEAFAQTATTPPRRIVFVFTANGDQIAKRFVTKHETNFVFDDMLTPFEPDRSKLLVLEGINKYHWKLPDGERSDGHQQGGSALAPFRSGTGSFPLGGTCDANGQNCQYIGYVKGPTLDYAIGDRLMATNPNLRFRHLYFRVGGQSNDIWNTHGHAGPIGMQNPIPAETNPFTAYTRIFAGIDLASQQRLARRLAMRQSSLDLVKGELTALRAKVGTADKARLDQHTESMREIERGLSSMMPTNAACLPLTMPTAFDPFGSTRWRDVGNLFFKISAMAFACDLTRTVNFNWSGNTSDRIYTDIGMADGHHSISHDSSAAAFDKIRKIKKNLFGASTQLHTELKNISDGAGKTLWDNTLVVHWSELSQGDTHQTDQDLVVMAGGAQNYFRMGRYLNFAAAPKRSFSHMLVSCAQYMGMTDMDSWGAQELYNGAGTGPLVGLT